MNFRERTAAIRATAHNATVQDSPTTAADTLRAAMDAQGMMQRELAHELGVSRGYISNILGNGKTMSIQFALHLERVLGLSARTLLVQQLETQIAKEEAKEVAAKGGHPCKKSCAGGSACALDNDVYHTLHCCTSPSCTCHKLSEAPAMARRRARQDEKAKQVESCTRLLPTLIVRQKLTLGRKVAA